MRSLAPLLFVPPLLLVAAFRGNPGAATPPDASTDPPQAPEVATDPAAEGPAVAGAAHVVARRTTLDQRVESMATLVPEEADELGLWLEEYAGELVFVEVRAHGETVAQGDVVARIEAGKLERQLASAGRATRAAELALRGATERGELAAAGAAVARAAAGRALAEAREDLTSWKEKELAELARSDELAAQRTQHFIDDAQDELTQLELMYADDELVQATEEIVLRRSRRDLAHQKAQAALGAQRRARTAALRARTTAARERAVESAQRALHDLGVEQALATAEREQGLEEARVALEEARRREAALGADLEALTLRAPRDGVLLHGSRAGWDGGQRAEHAVGGRALPRTGLFLVADPDRLVAVFTLPPADRPKAPHGAAATLRPVGSEREMIGRLEVERYPSTDGDHAARVVFERALIGQTAGSPAEVSLAGKSVEALLLPKAAVRGRDGERWCWVAGQGQDYRRVEVRVVATHDGDLSVEGDVPEGARVLLSEE